MIAVDASAIIAFFLKEEGWEDLAKYMKYTVSVGHAVKEFYNAVWKALTIHKRISREEAEDIISLFKEFLGKNMVIADELEYIDEAYEISTKYNITIYDSLYVVLALSNNIPLLTLDQIQRRIARKIGVETYP